MEREVKAGRKLDLFQGQEVDDGLFKVLEVSQVSEQDEFQ